MKKIFKVFVLAAVLAVATAVTSYAGTFGWAPNSGDAVYRDMATWWLKSQGHAGLCVANGQIMEMQKNIGCRQISFSDFCKVATYWGAMYAGDWKAADKRILEAKRIYKAKPGWDFYMYKYPYDLYYRCDGFVEKCFETGGNDIIYDYHWSSLSPQMQWKAFGKMNYRAITATGEKRFAEPIVAIRDALLW
ncbi:MAG: hypothetical protein V1891_01815 [bacterium]